ncbi:MAG: hypothetical protein KIT09_08625 [Bryobacteraceae bacterium]|nr:hypothetical protein [Bryobacteraceae bacterium]
MAVKSDDDARKVAEMLLKKIEFLRNEASERRERFEALAREQLMGKIKGETSQSPYFYAQGWGGASPGGTTTYRAYVHNPDPTGYSGFWLFGHLFFGPANFIGSSDLALTSTDPRFTHYYQRCEVAAGSDANMNFTIDVPSGLRPGIYIGNCFLLMRNSFDVGSYHDRAAFDLTVN